MGLGLKDADDVHAVDNAFLNNGVGLHLDNSPRGRDVENAFEGNAFVGNDRAVRLFPSVKGNRFVGNDFIANGMPVFVPGGSRAGQVAQNEWRRNHWDAYVGFDDDGDGVGDVAFVHARLVDAMLTRYPDLKWFAESPALAVVDAASRFFPLLRPAPTVIDEEPRLEPESATRWSQRLGLERAVDTRSVVSGAAWVLMALACLGVLWLGVGRGAS